MQVVIWVLLSFCFTFVGIPYFIRYFQHKKIGQTTREEGPLWHEVKTGTPTMGGTVFVLVFALVTLLSGLFTQQLTVDLWMIVLTITFFGGIGFVDDFISIFKKRNEGLSARQKFLWQSIFAFGVIVLAYILGQRMVLPFPGFEINQVILVSFFGVIWLNGFSNAVNLTDGLDGLSTGLSIIAYLTFAFMAYYQGNSAVGMACLILVAALLAFLYYNRKPAKIFMGDVGSLALGAGLAITSLILNHPWGLIVIGIVFVLETLSVILQVTSFKLRGKRIFKMSPIHHHFEMSGWSESRVVYTFWLVGCLASLVYLVVYLIF